MPKNLIICCDGTNNQLSGDRTNVARMASVASGLPDQLVYYDPGVGTMPDLWSRGKIAQVRDLVFGLAMGRGFEDKLMEAYRFLMRNYQQGDRIYLFGFSRGAYTVRALAGLIHSVGLLNPGLENMVRYAVKYWKKDFDPRNAIVSEASKACLELRTTYGRSVVVDHIGVWDTVSSIGMINHFKSYPYTRFNPSVRVVRHAVSIDERRKCFRQNLASATSEGPDVKNVWFPGVHSDVGGGYAEKEAGLAMLTFDWMIAEAMANKLVIDPQRLAVERARAAKADACGKMTNSLVGGWKIMEWIPVRKWNWMTNKKEWRLARNVPRDILRNAKDPAVFIHGSVIERMDKCGYRPVNLPGTEAEIRKLYNVLP